MYLSYNDIKHTDVRNNDFDNAALDNPAYVANEILNDGESLIVIYMSICYLCWPIRKVEPNGLPHARESLGLSQMGSRNVL